MTTTRKLSCLSVLAMLVAAAPLRAQSPASSSARQMTDAARALLAVLDAAQLGAVLRPLDDEERSQWSNVPYAAHHRPGLRLGRLDREEMLQHPNGRAPHAVTDDVHRFVLGPFGMQRDIIIAESTQLVVARGSSVPGAVVHLATLDLKGHLARAVVRAADRSYADLFSP